MRKEKGPTQRTFFHTNVECVRGSDKQYLYSAVQPAGRDVTFLVTPPTEKHFPPALWRRPRKHDPSSFTRLLARQLALSSDVLAIGITM